jgi:two-component system response regulator GlrR
MRWPVLIVDDDPDNLKILGLIARTVGVRVRLAGSPAEALALLSAGRYRKMITDFVMPDMDGFTLARYARELDPALEVVMMTGSCRDDLHELAAAAGINTVVTKPLSSEIFLALL